MNHLAVMPRETLPQLIDKATAALDAARTSAEVLEAREMARLAYDAAKSAARIAKAKQAHDTLMVEVHRSQAHALAIRARAEMRLAEEYDAAQERGEVASGSVRTDIVASHNDVRPATAADLGLRRDEIHEARKLRDAEAAEPGIVARTINDMVEQGEEPTSAALRRKITERTPPPKREIDRRALWLWGRLQDFERDGVIAAGAQFLASEMTPAMRQDVRRLTPKVTEFLAELERFA
jgi:hypothetical protein